MPDWLRLVLIGLAYYVGVSMVSGVVYCWAAWNWKRRDAA